MSRTSTVVWGSIGVVVAVLGILALVYGPGLYREGKALVGPIMDLTKFEDRLAALNDEFPFEPPADGVVPEDRFAAFLAIRRALAPTYREWDELERELDREDRPEDWRAAKEVLGKVQDVFRLQAETLRLHRMSPAEFNWIEDLVYHVWHDAAADAVASAGGAERLREATAADLELLGELQRRYGASEAGRRFTAHLERRLAEIEDPGPPHVDGVADATSAMFWAHRDELAELDFSGSELHDAIRRRNVNVEIGGD